MIYIYPLIISASKSTLSLNNLKILRHKVIKNLTNLRKKVCESPPAGVYIERWLICALAQ